MRKNGPLKGHFFGGLFITVLTLSACVAPFAALFLSDPYHKHPCCLTWRLNPVFVTSMSNVSTVEAVGSLFH